jgi:hypothetical protein
MEEVKEAVKVDELYDRKLDFETIMNNPILQPISEVNTTYRSQGLIVARNLWEYEQIKTRIDEMVRLNPVYSETLIFGEIQSLINVVKQIIHAQDVQRDLIKGTINEMVHLSDKYYQYAGERRNISKSEPIEKKEINPIVEDIQSFHSELLDKELPVPYTGKPRGRPKKEAADINENNIERIEDKMEVENA